MNIKSHIPKPLLFSKLKLLALGLFTTLSILFINPITAYAGIEDEIADRVVAQYNGTSSSHQGGTTAIVNGVSYARTGYLCYLLTKDGATVGLPAYAFASPGYNGIAGSKWVCTSRRGQSVSSWRGTAPWGVTPWENGGSPSNEPKIKEWFLAPSPQGVSNAQQFVVDIWGLEAAKNFESDQYILVIETIMNFQYSVAGGNSGSGSSSIDPAIRNAIIGSCYFYAKSYVDNMSPASLNGALSSSGKSKKQFTQDIAEAAANRALSKLQSGGTGGGRTFTSDPLIGTVPNLITFKNGNTVFDSYTNKVAPHSEKIKVSEAGFTAYTGSGKLTDSEVETYGVAMLIIHCKNSSIHTYWEPHGSPGNPEPRLPNKTGTCNIVKGYYKENLTTGAKQSLGVYHELDVTSQIIVSGEPHFELVEWRVTNQTSTGVNPTSWNPPGTTTQSGKSGANLKLQDPEECVYVLL